MQVGVAPIVVAVINFRGFEGFMDKTKGVFYLIDKVSSTITIPDLVKFDQHKSNPNLKMTTKMRVLVTI